MPGIQSVLLAHGPLDERVWALSSVERFVQVQFQLTNYFYPVKSHLSLSALCLHLL